MSLRTRSVAVAVRAIIGTVGKELAQLGELAVFGPEIMPPFADAMRLVNGQQVHLPPLQIGQDPESISRSGAA